jgi:DNA-directed RNA polymerase beta subunit
MSGSELSPASEDELTYGFNPEKTPTSPYISPDLLIDADEEAFGRTDPTPDGRQNLVAAEDLPEVENIITKMVIPPPYALTTENVDYLENVNIPGEITVSREGKLLQNYLTMYGFTADNIEGYDHMLKHGIPTRLAQTKIDLPNGNYVKVTRVTYSKPQTSTTEDSTNLTPLMSREQGYTYAGDIYADMVEIDGATNNPISSLNVRLGKIPVMLGSSLDHLRGLTERQRLELGECGKDPLGYFIIKGSEYLVLLREQLRFNRFLMYIEEGVPVCRTVCRTPVGTTIITLGKQPKSNAIHLSLRFLNKGTLNIYQVFRMLGVSDPDTIFQFIKGFTKQKYIKKIWLVLQQTYIDYLQIGDDVGMINAFRNETHRLPQPLKGEPTTAAQAEYEMKLAQTLQELAVEYRNLLISELFPQIPNDQLNNKVYLFSMMIARYVENLAGLRPLDDRDSWGNKRIISAGPAMTQLFGWCWEKMLRSVRQAIETASKRTTDISLRTVVRALRPTIITEDFEASFTTHNWGCKNGGREENYTDILKRGSLLDAYAHMLQVKAPIDTKTKTVGVRMVHMSQLGYIDAIETPEGEGCGLIKAKAVTCWISIDRGEAVIRQYLQGNISEQPSQTTTTVCILNGKFLGWCPGIALRDYLVGLRRSGNLAKDISILYHPNDDILWLDTDGQRPTRPLLIVNPETGVLLIEEKNLWGSSFPKLMEEGCVEYIDAWEQEYIMLAQSVNDIKARRDQLQEAIENHERAQADLARIQGGTRLIRTTQTEGPDANMYRALTAEEYEGRLEEKRHEKARMVENLRQMISLKEKSVKTSEAELIERHSQEAIQQRKDEAIKAINDSLIERRDDLELRGKMVQAESTELQAKYERIQGFADPEARDNATRLYNQDQAEFMRTYELYQEDVKQFQQAATNIEMLHENARQNVQDEINKEVAAHETSAEQIRAMRERMASLMYDLDEPIKIDEEQYMTEDDAKEAVQLAASVIRKIQAKRPYSHSEIDPNATLGVASSIIPLPDHNQAPRNVYQCIAGDSEILCSDGSVKQIKDLKNGDSVITVNPKTHHTSETKIHSFFGIPASANGKKVLEIETWSGRKIQSTDDHRFLTLTGWKEAGDLDTTTDHILIMPTTTLFEHMCESTVSTNSHIVVEWLKYVENTISERTTLRKTVSDLHDQGMTHPQLAKKFNITVAQSQHFCKSYKDDKTTNLPIDSIRLEDWVKCVQVKGECIYVPIKSIKQIDDCMVYDFTTESENHSFVANGFVTHNCGMGKQALGVFAGNHRFRFGTTSKMLAFPSRPLFETQMNKMIGLDDLPGGETVVLAIMTYMGYNQEDAIIMKQGAIDRGLFRMMIYKSLVATKLKNIKVGDTITTESFERPPPSKNRSPGAYDNLDERGVARVGSTLRVGDCAIGKVRIISEGGRKRIEDASTYVRMGEDGIVDRVIVSNNGNYPVIKVKVRKMRKPIKGDKFASRHAQKSTVGLILPDADMPFTLQGISPDIIMNPHAIPSRMTLGNLIEVVASKHAAMSGERVNATAFNDFDIDEFRSSLTQYGFNEWGYETMYNGMTGKPFQVQIFVGPCYYQALKHHVADKIQMRQRGAVQSDTRQPVGGRKNRGGIRFGEMERDALISHGAASVLQERLCLSSDAYKPVFCKTCGTIAIANHISKQYICHACGDDAQFGTCTIPYSFKLLTQLLAGAGIKVSLGMADTE